MLEQQVPIVENPAPKETSFKPDLGLQAGIIAGTKDGKFNTEPVDKSVIADKLKKPTGERWDFQSVDKVSMADRQKNGIPKETWVPTMQKSVDSMNAQQQQQLTDVMSALGCVDPEGSRQLDVMLETFAFAKDKGTNTQAFLEKIAKLPDIENKMGTVKFVAESLFGSEVAGSIVAQMSHLEGRIEAAKGEEEGVKLEALAAELAEASKTIKGSDTEKIIDSANKLLDEEQVKQVVKKADTGDPKGALEDLANTSNGSLASASEMGNREEQQDFVWTQTENLPTGVDSISIVADGHGVSGETASRFASQKFLDVFNKSMMGGKDVKTAITEAIADTETQLTSQTPDGGTTFIAGIKMGDKVYVVNVGDSRAYKVNEQTTEQVTTDHDWPKDKWDDDSGHHFDLQLSRSMGDADLKRKANGEITANPDIFETTIKAGEYFIFCCDGIHKTLSQDEITAIVKGKTPQEAAAELVKKAIEKGSSDNVSAIVMKG